MPIGGILPSCFVCKWAKPHESGEPFNPIECQKYALVVSSPSVYVCSDLTGTNEETGLKSFVKEENLESEIMYAWFQFSYRVPESPTLPLYHHELVKLASFQEFSRWSPENQVKIFRQRQEERKNELLNADNDEKL
jgi:hypothetical protein